ncbi:MAG: hypothetical protein M1838_001679 [Thelocarpon superellum]|nr:MAG: hypothetical protein M1838_001679 [Thelocarpon superellum]
MAARASFLSLVALLLVCYGGVSWAAMVTYDFNITWVTASPDGFERPTIGINGQWPLPPITADKGDRIIVNLVNQLGNQSTSLHFHGIFQTGSTDMDGPAFVSQCPVPPGASFQYNFTVNQPGTYWYHSHTRSQYPDGLRGPLIIHDPDSPLLGQYDEELVLTVSDWYHDQMTPLMEHFISVANPTGAEPIPDAALWNDTQNLDVPVQPGKTYLIRMVNVGAFAGQYVWFEGHTMRIVEVDGVYTEPAEAAMIYITAAQRYSVLLTTKNDTSANYAFVASMDEAMFDTVPDGLNPNVTGWLVYNTGHPLPDPVGVDDFEPFDDFTLIPADHQALLDKVDYSLKLAFEMNDLGDGANYAFFNGVTYVSPQVPTLFTALSTGANATNPVIYGANTNAFVLNKDDVVEIVVNSNDPGKHPFHLHGHNFQAVVRADDNEGAYNGTGSVPLPAIPMRRDTFMVKPNANVVLRFQADNPDTFSPSDTFSNEADVSPRIWLFHCHIEWHIASGLVATMIEAPTELQKTLQLTPDHLSTCRDQGIPTAGNAAGNTADLLDLSGNNYPPAPLPDGFTARGIVALVFSVLSAFIGMAVITWYGSSEFRMLPPPELALHSGLRDDTENSSQ